MNSFLLPLLLAVTAVVEVPPPTVHPKVKRGGRRIETAHITPARVTIAKRGIKGADRMPDLEEDIGRRLTALVSSYLGSKGVKLLPAADSGESAQYEQADLQRRYDTVDQQLSSKPGGVSNGRVTLSDAVAASRPAAGTDCIVFIRGKATVLDRTERIIGTVPGPWMWAAKDQVFDGHLAFVDSRSGEVLIYAAFTTYGYGWKLSVDELLPRLQDTIRQMRPPASAVFGTNRP